MLVNDFKVTYKAAIVITLLPVIGLFGCCVYEQVRWLINLKGRREVLNLCYDGGVDRLVSMDEPVVYKVSLTKDEIMKEYKDISREELYPRVLGPSLNLVNNNERQKEYNAVKYKGRFINPFWQFCDRNPANIFNYVRWKVYRKNRHLFGWIEHDENMITLTPNLELINSVSKNLLLKTHLLVTWLGQSTCFIQVDGYNIITDPALGKYLVSRWIGPKRLSAAPCKISDLPPIDVVLISHDHYDHLERKLINVIGNSATWVVPLGIGKNILARYKVHNFIELSWWESCVIDKDGLDSITITATPAQHWGGTHFFDVNENLWCSMFIKTKNFSIFHCGDSGYCSAFKEIQKRLGCPLLALLPIGAYEPRWYLKYDHVSPWEAIKIHTDLGAKFSLGIHWGTYSLTDEPMAEPPRLLKLACDKLGICRSNFITTKIGSTISFSTVSPLNPALPTH